MSALWVRARRRVLQESALFEGVDRIHVVRLGQYDRHATFGGRINPIHRIIRHRPL